MQENATFLSPSLARSREARFASPNRRACSQAIQLSANTTRESSYFSGIDSGFREKKIDNPCSRIKGLYLFLLFPERKEG